MVTVKNSACILFTSGSTGIPKAVQIPQDAILRLICNSNFWDTRPGEHILQTTSFTFDVSLLEIWGSLINNATCYFCTPDTLISPASLESFIEKESINIVWLTASLLNTLSQENPYIFK